MIKRLYVFIISLIWLGGFSCLAQENTPILLHIPKDWRYEKIDFPLDFAPNIPYEGFEELRFAPGMFDPSSDTYFTYVFALSIRNKTNITKNEIIHFLSEYYVGLCDAVAKSRKLSIDSAKIAVDVSKSETTDDNVKAYNAKVLFFDAFNSGQKVVLHIALEIITDERDKKLYLLALVSPHKKQSDIWHKLYGIKAQIKTQLPKK